MGNYLAGHVVMMLCQPATATDATSMPTACAAVANHATKVEKSFKAKHARGSGSA